MPEFSASRFISDAGVVRLWRLNDQKSYPEVIVAVYSPYQGKILPLLSLSIVKINFGKFGINLLTIKINSNNS
nr:DUF1481 domain-containing protein [Arsenophonus endosymbiont of Bemisia tabaci]